jgi:hypothetical protein
MQTHRSTPPTLHNRVVIIYIHGLSEKSEYAADAIAFHAGATLGSIAVGHHRYGSNGGAPMAGTVVRVIISKHSAHRMFRLQTMCLIEVTRELCEKNYFSF